jgi:hypothetical protein
MGIWWANSQAAPSGQEKLPCTRPHNLPKRMADNEWLAGQLNHLTREQESKFLEFKHLCVKEGYIVQRKDENGTDYDDAMLL